MNPWVLIVIVVLSFGGGWKVEGWRWDAAEKNRVVETHTEYVYKDRIKEKIVKEFVDRIVPVQSITEETVNEARNMAPSVTCPNVPDRFVELHDYSARGDKPQSPGQPDGTASSTTPAQAATVITENYGLYHLAELKVAGLQKYITEVCSPSSSDLTPH